MAKEVACPHVHANGQACPGHITQVHAQMDVLWAPDAEGKWRPSLGRSRSFYHLICSERHPSAKWQRDQLTALGIELINSITDAGGRN
jgi:hypothetical protein